MEGRLNYCLIDNSPITPSRSTFRYRFGGIMKAYELIGYKRLDLERHGERQRGHLLREQFARDIVEQSRGEISLIRPNRRWRCKLRLNSGVEVAVIISRIYRGWKGALHWMADPCSRERDLITLFVRFGKGNETYFDFHVFPKIEKTARFVVTDDFMKKGIRVNHISEITSIVENLHG
jgi:hypothetical protein